MADELAFLPAALEIVESPPSPLGRTIAVLICAFAALALVWSYFGRVDIVSTARGEIIPSGRVKIVQPFYTGAIRAILVHDGQKVSAGQVLIELDPTMAEAQQQHTQDDLISAQLDIARLRAALADAANPADVFHPPEGADPEFIATQKLLLVAQVAEHRAQIAALDRQAAQKVAERDSIAGAIQKLKATIPIVQQIVDVHKTLFSHQTGSKLQYLGSLQTLIQQQHDLTIAQSRLREANAALAAIAEARKQTEAMYRRKLSAELADTERKAAGLADDLTRAKRETKLQVLTAPVAGIVQQLAIHTVGGIVTPAQRLLVIVPDDYRLQANVMVPNDDVGFVHAGQRAEIKVEAFDYTRYGLLHGRVVNISRDSIARAPSQGAPSNGAGSSHESGNPSGSNGGSLNYEARVALDRSWMQIGNSKAALLPGMAVTVEIKTGSRTILSYLLSPIAKYQHDSLRER